MKFDVYGRFQIEVRREANDWAAYRIALGKRTKINLRIETGRALTCAMERPLAMCDRPR